MLIERARRWREERRRAIAFEAAALAAGWGFAAAGGLALADRLLVLPQSARLALWAAGAAALAVHAWRTAAAWRGVAWDEVFAAAADAWPETRSLLASAWQLAATPEREGVSGELRREHLARADALAGRLTPGPLFHWTPSAGARRGAAAAAAALALNALWGDSAAWARALVPWRDVPLERYVEAVPGDARLDWGRPAAVSARPTPLGRAAGARPGAVRLQVRGSDRRWRDAAWERVEEDAASFALASLDAPFEYRLHWRGLPGRAFRLEPVAPPRWRSLRAVVRAPRGERVFVLGEASAVRARGGDWVSVVGEPEEELTSSLLRVSVADMPIVMRRGAGGAWSGSFLATHDATLVVEPVAADGRRDPAPSSYALIVAADEAPKVELLSPQMPLQASPDDAVPVAYAARDDGALMRVELVRRDGAAAPRRVALPLPAPPGGEAVGDHELSLRGLAPGTEVEFWLEALDDGSPPRAGRSASGRVTVVDFAAAHRAAQDAAEKAFAAVGRAAAKAEQAAAADRAGKPASAREAHDALAQAWTQAAAALAEFARAQEADAQANPGLAEQNRRLAAALTKAGESGLPRAAQALSSGDAAKAEREHAALAALARGAERTLADGGVVQAVQDMDAGAETAEREARRISDALERAQEAGKAPSGAELAELEKALASVERELEALRKAAAELPQAPPEMDLSEIRRVPLDGARSAAAELRRALKAGDAAAAAKAAKRLAQELEKTRRAVSQAGRGAAEQHGRRSQEGVSRVKRAWQKAVEEQGKAVEAARRAEDGRDAALLAAQKGLLAETAASLGRLLSTGTLEAGAWPADARRHGESVQRDLQAQAARGAAERLRAAAGSLRVASTARPPDAGALEGLAKGFDALASRLESGPPRPAASAAAAAAAVRAQSAGRESIAALRGEVESATRLLGFAAAQARRRVEDAFDEAARAERALGAGDTGEGLKRGEAALTALQDGEGEAGGAEGEAEGMGQALSMPFGAGGGTVRVAPGAGGAGAGGARGSSLGRVRLPRADEYRPPRRLREELERSRLEPRPPAREEAVKEYFRRLSR